MEIKNKKKKTLAGIFAGYILKFTMLTVFWGFFCFILMFGLILTSGFVFLPANYAELMLEKNKEEIKNAETVEEELIPSGSQFGVYDQKGRFLYGSFDQKEQKTAWQKYQKDNSYAQGKGYYRFFQRKNREVCIVKYYIEVRYAKESWNEILPPAEQLSGWGTAGLFAVLVLLSGFFLSRRFAGRMKKELAGLGKVTEKIASNDLDFEIQSSGIREIEAVMISLEKMRDALKKSLKEQWDGEHARNRQLSDLAHDIKTPLTVVRGNAELLAEGELCPEELSCVQEILENACDIDRYLDSMRQVLKGENEKKEQKRLPCCKLAEELKEAARQMGTARRIPVCLESENTVREYEGTIFCCSTELLRAWKNIVSNGLEHTEAEKGIRIEICETDGEDSYLVASVRDYGTGFSKEALLHGAEAFFSGDESRHDRNHQGLGLSIAEKFIKEQGGFLKYQNAEGGSGARVSLWIKKEACFSVADPAGLEL